MKQQEQNRLPVEWWPLAKLKPYENNPRINDHAVGQMAGLIREFGFRRPFLVRGDGQIIDGHLMLKGALRAGKKEGPVLVCDDLSEAQIKALRLAMNKSSEWAQWDEEKLAQEMEELLAEGFDARLAGFDQAEVDELTAALDFNPVNQDEQPRLDKKREITCPECGAVFEPKD